jgi:hypothetical protein
MYSTYAQPQPQPAYPPQQPQPGSYYPQPPQQGGFQQGYANEAPHGGVVSQNAPVRSLENYAVNSAGKNAGGNAKKRAAEDKKAKDEDSCCCCCCCC